MVWLHYKRKQTDRLSVDTINSNRASPEVSLWDGRIQNHQITPIEIDKMENWKAFAQNAIFIGKVHIYYISLTKELDYNLGIRNA